MRPQIALSSVLLSPRTFVKDKVGKGNFTQTPGDRNIAIIRYLKKYDGQWKNSREINTHQKGSELNPAILKETLLDLDAVGFIEKRESQNPQARPYEYRITQKGKDKLEKLLRAFSDPDLKHLAGLKREISEEDDFHEF